MPGSGATGNRNVLSKNKLNLVCQMQTATATKECENGSGIPAVESKGTQPADIQVSKSGNMKVCPECGGPLRFGSRDPCEGDYYWCRSCGLGPILFPLGEGPRALSPLLDADLLQAARDIRRSAAAIASTPFADAKPFDPEKFVNDIVGS